MTDGDFLFCPCAPRQQITMDWAMKEFNAADEEDRAGLADQNTARMFYACEFWREATLKNKTKQIARRITLGSRTPNGCT